MENLTETITQLIRAIEAQSGFNLSDWVMVALTSVYVFATICIYKSNMKSANAATKQVEEMKNIQEQNANIQLFDKRHKIYVTFAKWYYITEAVFESVTTSPQESFKWQMFGNMGAFGNKSMDNLMEHREYMVDLLQRSRRNKEINDDTRQFQEQLQCAINNISDTLYSMQREKGELSSIKYLYTEIDEGAFESVNHFISVFCSAVFAITDKNLLELKKAFEAVKKSSVLHKMENDLAMLKKEPTP